jgi:hypothetical protein
MGQTGLHFFVKNHTDCTPAWTSAQDPDEGGSAESTKEAIWSIVSDPAKRKAP